MISVCAMLWNMQSVNVCAKLCGAAEEIASSQPGFQESVERIGEKK